MPEAEKVTRHDAEWSADSESRSGGRFLFVAAILVGALAILAVALFELAMVYLIV
jgi:hypothetical protein